MKIKNQTANYTENILKKKKEVKKIAPKRSVEKPDLRSINKAHNKRNGM